MARWPPGWHASSQASSQALAGWLSQVSGEEFLSSCACVCMCVLVQCSHLEAWHAMATEMPPKAAATKQLNGALCSRAPVMAGCGLACLSRPAAVGCYAGSLSTTSGTVGCVCCLPLLVSTLTDQVAHGCGRGCWSRFRVDWLVARLPRRAAHVPQAMAAAMELMALQRSRRQMDGASEQVWGVGRCRESHLRCQAIESVALVRNQGAT